MREVFVSTSVLDDGLRADVAVERLIEMGFTHIEIGSTHVFANDYAETIAPLKDRAVLIVHNYFPPVRQSIIQNLASPDNDILSASIAQIKNSIDFCRQLELDLYSFHPGFIGQVIPTVPDKKNRNYDFGFNLSLAVNRKRAFEIFIDSLKRICDYAARYDMKIACENSGSISKNEFILMNTCQEFLGMFEQVDYPGLGILLDIGHLKLSAKANLFKAEEFVSVLQSHIFEIHVHENDSANDQHSYLYPDCDALELLKKFDFSSAKITFEGRNLIPVQIDKSVQLLRGL